MRTPLLLLLALSCAAPAFGQSSTTPDMPLPTVVLVGDSIRMSYASVVARQLDGKAVVVSSKANGGDSSNVLKNLKTWVIQHHPAIVHVNCGIHDTKHFRATGKFQVSPEQYAANLRKIVQQIRDETNAVVVFATTTPILDDRAASARDGRAYELLEASVSQYNTIAEKLMAELKVPVNDLHAAISMPEKPLSRESLIGKDGVHLTPSAKELLGRKVAAVIAEQLAKGRRR